MISDDNKALYRRFVDGVINNGRYEDIPNLYTADYVDHSSPPGAPGGFDGVRAVFAMFRGAFPDVHFAIDEMVAEGEKVATRVTGHGTNDGPMMGMPPSGRKASWGSKGIFRVVDGRIAEHWGQPDLRALMGQIGAIPPGAPLPVADPTTETARSDVAPADPTDAATLARNKGIVRRLNEDGYSKGDMAAIADLVAADFVDHPTVGFDGVPRVGTAAMQGQVQAVRQGFPDLAAVVEDLIAEGNSIVVRATLHGTHTGPFAGIPATGKSVAINTIDFFRVGVDGSIVERFGGFDSLGTIQQLGLVPPPGGSH